MSWIKLHSKKIIFAILFLAVFIRLIALVKYGLSLTLNSDDQGYVRSAKVLLESGMLTYHRADNPTVHIMPGQSILLAILFFVFGTGTIGIYAAKLAMISFGVGSVYVIYLIGKYLKNEFAGLVAAFLLAISIPQVLTDNLLLTEAPFMLSMLLLLYYSIKLGKEHTMQNFYLLFIFYILALMFKATIALYPILLFVYLLLKKYPLKLALKQFGIAVILLLIVLGPWWARNYIHYNEFIPLTGGAGNPLLLGTYQGKGNLYGNSMNEELAKLARENPGADAYTQMKLQEEIAKERIKNWWDNDPKTFLESYFFLKPKMQWASQFYWIEIFEAKQSIVQTAHKLIVLLFFLSIFTLPFMKKYWKEYFLLLLLIVYNTTLNSIYFAYDRYNQPLMPILYLYIGTAISLFAAYYYKLRRKYR